MEVNAIFRPAKRRKFARQHGAEHEEEDDILRTDTTSTRPDQERDTSPENCSMSNILRIRRQQKNRAGGVQFSNTRQGAADDASSNALVVSANPAENLNGISGRFVGHADQVVDVNKHMVAYIDSEMAKRHAAHHPTTNLIQSGTEEDNYTANQTASSTTVLQPSTRQPTSRGLLNEVEVEDRAPQSLEPPPPKPRKPRLDRFGRPLPPRKPRPGRASEDIARDKLVEDILNESGLDVIYQSEPHHQNSGKQTAAGGTSTSDNKLRGEDANEEEDADSRLATQFQQEYLDAMQARQEQRKQKKKPATAAEAALLEQQSKGPKLGGSRQARAAMREREKEGKLKGAAK